ncbi:MAG: hypothetical protein ACXWQO_20165, partial [Bdellovibrionota bacterium]
MKFFLLSIALLGYSANAETLCPAVSTQPAGKPVLRSNPKAGTEILVCGYEDVKKQEGKKKFLSEFSIYEATGNAAPELLKMVTALDNFLVNESKEGLELIRLILYHGLFRPGFSSQLKCKSGPCTFTAEKCVFKKGSPGADKVDALLASYKTQKLSGMKFTEKLADLALSGDKNAQKIFATRPAELKLEGAGS